MQEIKDDILERTYQMRSLCLASETAAIQTAITLADQGEKLENINSRLTSIDETLINTKQDINRLKGLTQRVIGSFRNKFHQNILSKILLHSTKKQESLSSPLRTHSSGQINQRIIPSTKSFTDQQIDETLDDVEQAIHRLKDIAVVMNDQLIGQADTLCHIQEHTTKSTNHIERQNTDIKKYSKEKHI